MWLRPLETWQKRMQKYNYLYFMISSQFLFPFKSKHLITTVIIHQLTHYK